MAKGWAAHDAGCGAEREGGESHLDCDFFALFPVLWLSESLLKLFLSWLSIMPFKRFTWKCGGGAEVRRCSFFSQPRSPAFHAARRHAMRSGIRVGSGRRRDGIGTRVHSPHLASRTASFSAAHSPHSGAQPLFPNPPSWRTEPVAPPSASWEAAWRSQSPPGQLPGFHHSAFPWDRSDPPGIGPKLRQKTSEEQSAGWSGPNNRRPEPRSGLLGPPASALCRGNFWDPSHLAGHEASGTIIGAKSAKGGGNSRPDLADGIKIPAVQLMSTLSSSGARPYAPSPFPFPPQHTKIQESKECHKGIVSRTK